MSFDWIPFIWEGAEIDGRYFDKVSMFLEGRLPEVGLSGRFQFDLGAPNSVLYENNVSDRLNELLARIDPQRHIVLNGVEFPVIDSPLSVTPDVELHGVGLLSEHGQGEEDVFADGARLLGTMGADVVRGKCLIIDFPHDRLAILDETPTEYAARAVFTPLQRTPAGHVLLSLTVDGVEKRALFDTGSSIFELMTDKEQWQKLTDGKVADVLEISMWGEMKAVYGGKARSDFRLGNWPLEVKMIYRVDEDDWVQFNRAHTLVGLLGNASFLGHVVILDFDSGRFGVAPE